MIGRQGRRDRESTRRCRHLLAGEAVVGRASAAPYHQDEGGDSDRHHHEAGGRRANDQTTAPDPPLAARESPSQLAPALEGQAPSFRPGGRSSTRVMGCTPLWAHERPSTHEPPGDLLWGSCELDERLGAGHVVGRIARFFPRDRRNACQPDEKSSGERAVPSDRFGSDGPSISLAKQMGGCGVVQDT